MIYLKTSSMNINWKQVALYILRILEFIVTGAAGGVGLTAVELGYGNDGPKTPEGFRYRNVLASELTGPILVKNPRLLDKVVEAIHQRGGEPLTGPVPHDAWTQQGYAITAEQLKLRVKG